MPFYDYAIEYEPSKSGRSQSYDLNCSYKDLTQVLANLKGLSVAKAFTLIEECVELKKAIPFRKFNKGMGHRSELGGKKGKYPKKEANLALQLLNNAISNAKSKGLDEKNLVVLHACAYKQNVFPRYRKFFASSTVLGYGKQAMFSAYMTARAELVVGEKDAKKIDKSPRERARQNNRKKIALQAPKEPAKTQAKNEAKKEAKAEEAKEEKKAEKRERAAQDGQAVKEERAAGHEHALKEEHAVEYKHALEDEHKHEEKPETKA